MGRLQSIHTRKEKKSKEALQNKRMRGSMTDEFKEIQSAIPSRMKRQSNWVVTAGETLKGKQHTIVTTRQAFKDGRNEGPFIQPYFYERKGRSASTRRCSRSSYIF